MAFDSHINFAYSTVLTAPSPAISGTSLVLASGDGALMPTAPFNMTVWPTSVQPLKSNAEIIRVTAVTGDTLTIIRAQEGSSARTIISGDQIANTITAKDFTDIENTIPSTTDDLPEGSTNLYFTTARAQASITGTTNRISVTAGVVDISASYAGQSSITTLGTIGTGTWQGDAIGSVYGGTGLTSYAKGDLIYASAVNTLSKLSLGTTGYVLTADASGVPVWAAAAGGITAATSVEINTGTDNAKSATPLGLAGSKYIGQDGAKTYAVASGTNTYTATITPAIAAYATGMQFAIKFTNNNTGASTINLNSLGAKTIQINGVAVKAGDIIGLNTIVYDGTNFQLQRTVLPNGASKVVTTDTGGVLQTTYALTDLYLTAVNDTGGVKTNAQMNTAYPSAVEGNRVRGSAGTYEYFGVFGWVYYSFTII